MQENNVNVTFNLYYFSSVPARRKPNYANCPHITTNTLTSKFDNFERRNQSRAEKDNKMESRSKTRSAGASRASSESEGSTGSGGSGNNGKPGRPPRSSRRDQKIPENEGKSAAADKVDKVVVARKHPGVFMETSELVEETGVQLPVGIAEEGLGLASKGGSGKDDVEMKEEESVASDEAKGEEDAEQKMEESSSDERVTEDVKEVDDSEKEGDKETECIGEVEVAAVPDVKDELETDSVPKKLDKESEEKDKEGNDKGAEEKQQKETDTDQVEYI